MLKGETIPTRYSHNEAVILRRAIQKEVEAAGFADVYDTEPRCNIEEALERGIVFDDFEMYTPDGDAEVKHWVRLALQKRADREAARQKMIASLQGSFTDLLEEMA